MIARLSLRTRLLAGLVVLAAAGLLAADVATYSSLKSFLNDRVDDQLLAARQPVGIRLQREIFDPRHGLGFGPGRGPGPRDVSVPEGTYGELRGPNASITSINLDYNTPSSAVVAQGPPGLETLPKDLPATFTRGDWRVRAESLGDGFTLIIAVPLVEAHRTLSRLVQIEVLATLLVLAGLGALAWWVVRLGLRPLEAMGHTAGAIAAGDLSRRVEPADDRTEVGRLGHALNTMLGQIESAFAERTESENRLRRFVADAAHELRTPLTSIRGYAELFRRGAADRPEDLAKSMQRIEAEAARMGVLVEDLLLLARLDQGRPLDQAPVDLARIAVDAASDARAVAPERPVTVRGADGYVVVTGDDNRLRQAVHNLVGNALVHTPPSTPVEIAVGAENGHAVLAVIDHGDGIAAEDAPHVFERFYRVDESRTREDGGGTGLGLSIVAAIAEAHGGRAELTDTPGGGATFKLLVPVAKTEAAVDVN